MHIMCQVERKERPVSSGSLVACSLGDSKISPGGHLGCAVIGSRSIWLSLLAGRFQLPLIEVRCKESPWAGLLVSH